MADQKPGSDVFTGIAFVTLLFLIVGIVVAVLQLNEFSGAKRRPMSPTVKVSAPRGFVKPGAASGTVGEAETDEQGAETGGKKAEELPPDSGLGGL